MTVPAGGRERLTWRRALYVGGSDGAGTSVSDAVIANRHAYRAFFLDLDLWRGLSLSLQKMYFLQLYDFCLQSELNDFNIRRLVDQGMCRAERRGTARVVGTAVSGGAGGWERVACLRLHPHRPCTGSALLPLSPRVRVRAVLFFFS